MTILRTKHMIRVYWKGNHTSSYENDEERFLCKQDAISNKIPLKIKMEHLKFKLEIVEALSASSPTSKSILTDDEDNSVVIPLAKRLKRYNPPAIHLMAFILAIPG
ncbi:uncharacterized protein TNCV_4001761 [Trichonephila clavipes]|uniref:Uncharacterized protein n=1 Tax=Trichonephila clavipes TaxID=2585209 RepID=A0A8X6RST0_TRICX|nr:uncharacterized protein TNCV_4001761 [Trichonephila clavipes]